MSEFEKPLEDWEDILPIVQFTLNHMLRKVLGNRSPIHVMTGIEPESTLQLCLWNGVKLKDVTSIEAHMDMLEGYCRDLAAAIDVLHTEVHDADVLRARKKAAREARNKHKGAYAFNVGDIVMVAAEDNSANVQRRAKQMVRWQGPYQIVRRASATEFDVLLYGDTADRA